MQLNSTLDRLVPALIHVESQGKDDAIGDNGTAFGCLQITEAVLLDYNRLEFGKNTYCYYPRTVLFSRDKSVEICRRYLCHWGSKAGVSDEESLARIWNGGPRGHKKAATEKYWQKVKLFLPAK